LIDKRLKQDMDFITELDKMKSVIRATNLIGKDEREDDAQHSWHISVMAMILSEYADEDIDNYKVIKMLLIHDLVELFAGDTFCYDAEANKDKLEREIAAAEKLYGMIDEEKGQELRALWDEFEEMETPEALFATAMDRLQPILNNYYNNGGTWKRFEVPKSKIYERVAPIRKSSEKLWRFAEYMIEDAYDKGKIVAE